MDKEKEQGNVDSELRLLNFPKPKEDEPTGNKEYNINVVFTSGKTIQILCCGFVPMLDVGVGLLGFWSDSSDAIHTILNCNKVDFMDIEEREV
tara:strand:+ start:6117 stop:6395 length:279 start_codon:yes stop_codon:yes gene_type:complete